MKLLVLVMCLCSVSGFKIFPVAIEPVLPQVDVLTESVTTEAIVFTNLPTTNGASVQKDTAQDSTPASIELSHSEAPLTSPDADLALDSLSYSSKATSNLTKSDINKSETTTDSTNSSDSAVKLTSPIEVLETNKSPELATDSTTIANTDASITTSTSESAVDVVAVKASTILSEPAQTSTNFSESSAKTTSLSESPAEIAGLSGSVKLPNTEKTSTVLSDSSKMGTLASEDSVKSIESKTATSLSDSAADSKSTTESAASTSSPELLSTSNPVNTSPVDVTSTSTISPETETLFETSFETTTEDLSFLSLDLLPPKTEFRKNEPDPRYDFF